MNLIVKQIIFEYSNGIGGESCDYISEVISYIFSKIVKGLEVPQRDLKVGGVLTSNSRLCDFCHLWTKILLTVFTILKFLNAAIDNPVPVG